MSSSQTAPFGLLLKQLRKRAGMTQRDLAAALNYSDALISSLEKAQRLPDLEAVTTRFVPALGLQDDPVSATRLIEQAAAARGENPPESHLGSVTFQRATRGVTQDEVGEQQRALLSAPTELIGRTEELHQLCNRLLGHSGRLLTLVGPPGIGKTRLASAVAARLQYHYPDGAIFVALAEITDSVLVASAILAAVGSIDASSRPPKTKLIERLRRKSMLLVLDNCEQIRDAAPLVAELLAACAGIVILATSRERLHLRAEQRYHVPPLELGPAVELFTQRAAAVDARFELTDVNRPMLEAICQRLDRLPLALELCAAQTDLHSLAQLLAQLQDHRLDVLVNGAHDLPPQQRTLRRAIQRSYSLLSDQECALFRSLGIFVGGFDLEMVEIVGISSQKSASQWQPAALDSTLHALIGKSLVRVYTTPHGEQRFRLLETLREFALEQLRAQGEEAEMRRRHYYAYLQLFRTGDAYLRGPESATWVARLEPEQDNLRAALQWTLGEARYEDMAWLHIAVAYFWQFSGHRYEVGRWLAQLLPHRQTLAVELRLAILSDYYSASGEVEGFPSIDRYAAEMIDLMEICPYKQLHAHTWYFLAFFVSDAIQAADLLERAVMFAREASEGPTLGAEFCIYTDDDYCLSANQWGYSVFLIDRGEIAQATALVTDSLQRFRKRGNQPCIGDCLGTLGVLALLRGDIAQAHTHFQEVVTINKTHGHMMGLAYSQPYFGMITLYGGNAAEQQARLLEECLRLCLEIKNVNYLSRTCMGLAELALWEGSTEQAAHWLGQSFAYQVEQAPGRTSILELQRLFVAARLVTMQGHYQRAATLLGVVEAAHRRVHYVYAGPMLPLVNDALTKVREALGVELFDELIAAGQQLPLVEAYDTMLTPTSFANIVTPSAPT